MTVKQLKRILSMVDDDRIITIERPDEPEQRNNERYLTPTGYCEADYTDEYFVIYTD